MARVTPRAWGLALPVGGGAEISVADLSRRIVGLLGGDVGIVPDAEPPRRTEMWRSYCDNAEAGEILGWQPKVSLTEGLLRTLRADAPAWREARLREASPLGESL